MLRGKGQRWRTDRPCLLDVLQLADVLEGAVNLYEMGEELRGRPYLIRPLEGRIEVWMPFQGGSNRKWIHRTIGGRARPEYVGDGRWEIARSHLRSLVAAMAERFGSVHVVMAYNPGQTCSEACRYAQLDECICGCLGRNHKGGELVEYWGGPDAPGELLDDGSVAVHYLVRGRVTQPTQQGA